MIRGWDLIVPGFGGISTLLPKASLAARRLYEPQPISHQQMGVGVPHRAG